MNFILIIFFKIVKLAESNWPPGGNDFLGPGYAGPYNIRCMECIQILSSVNIKICEKNKEREVIIHRCTNHWCKNYIASIEKLNEMAIRTVNSQTGECVSNPVIARRRVLVTAEGSPSQNEAKTDQTQNGKENDKKQKDE